MCGHTRFFPLNHKFTGLHYIGFTNLLDKSNKLRIYRPYKRETPKLKILVIDVKDVNDIGGALLRYTTKFSPGQQRFHTRPFTESQKIGNMKNGCYGTMYHANLHLGRNTIANLF